MSHEIQTHPTDPTPRTRSSTCSLMIMIALFVSIAAAGCLADGRANTEPPELDDSADHSIRIEALKTSIERDHRTLENLITQPGLAADQSLHENPELRAIAQRLTAQERALERLESRVSSQTESSDHPE